MSIISDSNNRPPTVNPAGLPEGCHDNGSGRDSQDDPKLPPPAGESPNSHGPARTARLIVVVEGGHDVRFLKRVSHTVHADDRQLPDLRVLEQAGTIVFVPVAGDNFRHWVHRLSGLGIPEFHLYDKEVPPLTGERRQAAEAVNRRPGCHAVLTGKRALENYLDPQSLREVPGIEVSFGDDDDVPQLVAQRLLEQFGGPGWSELPSRGRRRLKDRAKKWLNTEAVTRMTAARLAERDPDGDIPSWLATIARLGGLRD